MNLKIEKLLNELLYGGLSESRQAKKGLVKELQGNQEKRDVLKKEMSGLYKLLFTEYANIKKHNKYSTISFISWVLFYLDDKHEYFKIFLDIVFEALKDVVGGSLRQSAVSCGNNIGLLASFKSDHKGLTGKIKIENKLNYNQCFLEHLDKVFDYLETVIEKDRDKFPIAIDAMKPSVSKSFLLYISSIDRFDVIENSNEIYEGEDLYPGNEYSRAWEAVFNRLLDTHPNVKNFVKYVPRFDLHKYEDADEDDYDTGAELVNEILEKEEKGFVQSNHFFNGISGGGVAPGGWSIPKNSYFEIMDIISQCNDREDLIEILDKVYIKAHFEELANMYWFDLVAVALSKIENFPNKKVIWKEIITRLLPKVDITKSVSTDIENGINALCYGVHEHRPIFRLLLAFALYNHDLGDKEVAKDYYKFLLKINPSDNHGVRYLLASLYAGKSTSYTDRLVDDGNSDQNWDKIEDFLNEQNKLNKFWDTNDAEY